MIRANDYATEGFVAYRSLIIRLAVATGHAVRFGHIDRTQTVNCITLNRPIAEITQFEVTQDKTSLCTNEAVSKSRFVIRLTSIFGCLVCIGGFTRRPERRFKAAVG